MSVRSATSTFESRRADVTTRESLAQSHLCAERYEECVAECRAALELDPDRETVYATLIEALRRMCRLKEAERSTEGAVSSAENSERCLLQIAELYRAAGRSEEGLQTLRVFLKRRSESPALLRALAELAGDLGRAKEMLEYASKAVALNPRDLVSFEMVAFAALQQGDTATALAALEKAVALAPSDWLNRFKLATLYHQKGDFENAFRHYGLVAGSCQDDAVINQVEEARGALDAAQLQQIVLLFASDALFRIKLARDVVAATREYGYHLSDEALRTLSTMDWSGFFQGSPNALGTTFH